MRGPALAFGALLLGSAAATAQVPITMHPAESCEGPLYPGAGSGARPTLLGFALLPTSDPLNLRPDLLFDQRLAGGRSIGLASLAADGLILPSNWRGGAFDERSEVVHAVLVFERGRLFYDAEPLGENLGSFGVVVGQDLCSLDGPAPEVRARGSRHVVRWRPVLELDPDGHPSTLHACKRAGSWSGRFFHAYVVYSLPVAERALPGLDDFFLQGARHVADLRTLDFEVPDADGRRGSDLDPADGLTLQNPDGLPDTGDEILSLELIPPGGTARWYTVQPVVRGEISYFGSATEAPTLVPSQQLTDRDGDGHPESADLLSDGIVEFTDPCRVGLGLMQAGEILTSRAPGQGPAVTPRPGSDVAPVPCDRGVPPEPEPSRRFDRGAGASRRQP